MRIQRVVPIFGVAAVFPILYFLFPRSDDAESIRDFTGWRPTPQEIAKTVGTGADDKYGDARHQQFAQMFQKRYRSQEHAVGLRFTAPGRIRAMFAPVIPRWDMAR